MATITQIKSSADFQQLLNGSEPSKLVVVDFTASWCGPCQMIAPFYNRFAEKYKEAKFAKLDVDEVQDVARVCGVSSMPTFQFYKGGKKIAEMKGANPQQLEMLIKQHTGAISSVGKSGSAQDEGAYGIVGHVDLTDQITLNQLDCLNQKEDHGVRNVLKADKTYLESDVDEQLIITIPFNQAVKLHSIKLKAPTSHAPKTIKIYANKQHMGFDEVDSIQETQTLVLTEEDYAEKAVTPLRFVKFQNVNSVVIFIEDNLGDEETTKLEQLVFIGSPLETTKMGELKKMEGQ